MAQQQLPEEAYQLGKTYQLGTPMAVYRTHYTQASILFFWSQVALALLAVVVAFSFLLAFEVFHAHVANLFLPVLLVFFALNITNTSRAVRSKGQASYVPFTRNLRVYVYTDGLIRVRTTRPEVIHWNEIRRVRCHTYSATKNTTRGFQPSVTIVRHNGKSLTFGANIADVTSLGKTIQDQLR
ncbi:MAG: hypothetical protein NVS2B2_02030 [Ktedonobacteraceae bacterium]